MKTVPTTRKLRKPQLLDKAKQLHAYLLTLSPETLAKAMGTSAALAHKTHEHIAAWSAAPERQSPAIDSFVGDIYSGLQVSELSEADREYAGQTLRILSGLYGIIRPDDGVCPYRLEMGYRLPDQTFRDLYAYWGRSIADCLPPEGLVVNVASVEYAKAVTPYIDASRIVSPSFLTKHPHTGEPTFVVVHAKIARGAFARWLIQNRITDRSKLRDFHDIGYRFDPKLSTPAAPAFVCETFGGKGLSMRLR